MIGRTGLRMALAALLFVSVSYVNPCACLAGEKGDLELTVYSGDLALIKDRRDVRLSAGRNEIRFPGVAGSVIPESVRLGLPPGVSVLEQNYEYDLLSPERLIDKYIGRDIMIVTRSGEKEESVPATVLAHNKGIVVRTKEGIEFNPAGRLVFPSVPEGLSARPTISWLIESASAQVSPIEASYLATGLGWHADYVLSTDQTHGALSAWVTIDNRSGTVFEDARVGLVSGNPNRAATAPHMMVMAAQADARFARESQPEEEGLFDYHLYRLPRPVTVRDAQKKQFLLFGADAVGVKNEYVIEAQPMYLEQSGYPVPEREQRAKVFISFGNSAANGLGIPMPAGVVRIYMNDAKGGMQFIGEDRVAHIAVDEPVRMRAGEAFDIVGTKKQTSWSRIDKNTNEAAYDVLVRNRKAAAAVVRVIEHFPGDWKLLESMPKMEKTDANTAECVLSVPAGGSVRLTYRVRMRQ